MQSVKSHSCFTRRECIGVAGASGTGQQLLCKKSVEIGWLCTLHRAAVTSLGENCDAQYLYAYLSL